MNWDENWDENQREVYKKVIKLLEEENTPIKVVASLGFDLYTQALTQWVKEEVVKEIKNKPLSPKTK